MTQVAMVVLQGQGDTYAFFLDPKYLDWFDTYDLDPPEGFWESYDPDGTYDHEKPYGSSGSWSNDRALATIDVSEKAYWTIGDALKAADSKDYEIVDTWEGYIY